MPDLRVIIVGGGIAGLATVSNFIVFAVLASH
jgi:cation diffusion facilitator CzcD-associated flavoprotein CzcO